MCTYIHTIWKYICIQNVENSDLSRSNDTYILKVTLTADVLQFNPVIKTCYKNVLFMYII